MNLRWITRPEVTDEQIVESVLSQALANYLPDTPHRARLQKAYRWFLESVIFLGKVLPAPGAETTPAHRLAIATLRGDWAAARALADLIVQAVDAPTAEPPLDPRPPAAEFHLTAVTGSRKMHLSDAGHNGYPLCRVPLGVEVHADPDHVHTEPGTLPSNTCRACIRIAFGDAGLVGWRGV